MGMFKKATTDEERVKVALVVEQLDKIYSNKSGDEYKMHGDITLSPVYDLLQRTITDLPLIKGLNKSNADELKRMFDVMHRPNFKKIVSEYIASKKAECIVITTTFTVAYRALISELSRIYTSTEATDKGFVYKPSKYAKKNSFERFIKSFNLRIDQELTKSIRATTKSVKTGKDFKMESYMMEGFVGSSAAFAQFLNTSVFGRVAPIFREFGSWCRLLFPDVSVLNPISWVSNLLSNKYDRKVSKFQQAAAMYIETKNAYDEYMKLPQFKRKKEVEIKYLRNIDKYNIKMQNAQAQIAHYDQRAIKETIEENKRIEEMEAKYRKSQAASPTAVKDDGTQTGTTLKTDEPKPEKTSKPEPASNDDDPFDF